MKTTLITGVKGFCGRHLARHLSNEGGHRLVGVDLDAESPRGLPLDEYLAVDVSQAEQMAAAIQHTRPDRIFHLAGLVRAAPADLYRVNLHAAVHLLEAVRRIVPESRVLLVGSAAEYGKVNSADLPIDEAQPCRPFGAYALSKYAMTLAALDYAQGHGMKVVVVRPFNIIGAGVPISLVVGAILQRIKRTLATDADPVVQIGNLETKRDFVAVEDVVRAYAQLLCAEAWGQVFNICSGQPRSIRSVVERLLSFSSRPVRLETDPSLQRPTDVPVVYGSWQKARRLIGFQPHTDLDVPLRAAWQHVIGFQSRTDLDVASRAAWQHDIGESACV